MPISSRPRCRNALSGAESDVLCSGLGVAGSRITVPTSAMNISTATPKNGPWKLMLPSTPPHQRTGGDAEPQRCLVEDDRAGEAAPGAGDDRRQ